MLQEIIGKIIAGAVVGYGTNDLAVKMLFRQYFGLGGVVIKTRTQFVDKISQLTEQEIIKHESIAEELSQEPFEIVFGKIIADYCQHKLPEIVPEDLLVGQVPGIDSSMQALQKTILESLKRPLDEILQYFSDNIAVDDLLPEAQTLHLAKFVSSRLTNTLENDLDLKSLFENLLRDLRKKQISDFLDTTVTDKIAENIGVVFKDFHLFLKYNYSDEVAGLFEKLIETLELDALIDNLSNRFSQKSIVDILGEITAKELPNLLLDEIKAIFVSDLGTDIIQTFLNFLIQLLKKEHYTIYDFLGVDLQQNLTKFFEDELPDLLQDLITWIREKKEQIDQLVDASFRENTKYLLQEWIVDLFVGSVSEQAQIVGEIIKIIDNQNPKELAENAAGKILTYLKETKISDILKNFNEEDLLPRLSPLIKNNLTKPIQELKINNLDEFLNQPIGNWISAEKIKKQLSDFLHKGLDERFIYTEKFSSALQSNIRERIQKIGKGSFGDFIQEDKITDYAQSIQKFCIESLQKNEGQISNFLVQTIDKYKDDKKLRALLSTQSLEQISVYLLESITNLLGDEVEKIKKEPLRKYVILVTEIQNFELEVRLALRKYLSENLEKLLKGQVERLVKENLTTFSNERIRDMVEQAMGKELQPISVFGAVLGAITGGLLIAMPVFDNFLINSTVAGLAYGITGWGTNWLAIQMIFKPYKGVKVPIINRNLLFTPGVIIQNRPRFASSMGDFIGEKLLSKDAIENTVKPRVGDLAPLIEKEFAKDDYAIVEKQLNNRKERFANFLSKNGWAYLKNNQSAILTKINGFIDSKKGGDLTKINTVEVENKIIQYTDAEDFNKTITDTVSERWRKTLEKNSSMQEILPQNIQDNLKEFAPGVIQNQINIFNGYITENENFGSLQAEILNRITSVLQRKLDDLLGKEQIKKMQESLRDFLHDKLTDRNTHQWIFEWIDERLGNEISDGKKMKDIFGGKIIQFVEGNIKDILKQILKQGLNWLQDNKQDIADRVYAKASDKTIGAYFYEDTIRNTVIDLADNKMPEFFEDEFRNLETIIHQKINQLGDINLQRTGISINRDSLQRKVKVFLENPRLIEFVSKLSNMILEERIYKLSVAGILKKDEEGLKDILENVLNTEIQYMRQHLKTQLDKDEKQIYIAQKTADLLIKIAEKLILPIRMQTIFKGIEINESTEAIHHAASFLLNNEAFKKEKDHLVESFLHNCKQESLEKIVDISLMKMSIEKIWMGIFENEQHGNYLQNTIYDTLVETIPLSGKDLAVESKDFLTKILAGAGVVTIEGHLKELIQSINLKVIVEEQINKMEPVKLEEFFYGFAGKYFTSLINYGFGFGIIFGLAIDFAILGLFYLFAQF